MYFPYKRIENNVKYYYSNFERSCCTVEMLQISWNVRHIYRTLESKIDFFHYVETNLFYSSTVFYFKFSTILMIVVDVNENCKIINKFGIRSRKINDTWFYCCAICTWFVTCILLSFSSLSLSFSLSPLMILLYYDKPIYNTWFAINVLHWKKNKI